MSEEFERRVSMEILVERLIHLGEKIDLNTQKLDALDIRLANLCATCSVKSSIQDHEIRLREVERDTERAKGLALGASLVTGALSFLGSWFLRK